MDRNKLRSSCTTKERHMCLERGIFDRDMFPHQMGYQLVLQFMQFLGMRYPCPDDIPITFGKSPKMGKRQIKRESWDTLQEGRECFNQGRISFTKEA
jgi:hypothetical protein